MIIFVYQRIRMKKKGSNFAYNDARNKDLVRAFRQQLAECSNIVLPIVLEKVVNSPSKRYWVSEERAFLVISAMLRGEKISIRRKQKREMFIDIYNRTKAMMQEHPELSVQQIVFRVVGSQAPRFFLTPESACVILSKVRNGYYDRGRRDTEGERAKERKY